MNTASKERITVKIFVGFETSIELRMHLNQSSAWKKASFEKGDTLNQILEVRFNEKNYIGRYLDSKILTMKDMKALSAEIRGNLQEYCPEINFDMLNINIFPQVFVA